MRSPVEAVAQLNGQIPQPPYSLSAFQEYYRRMAVQRGYVFENARDVLLLLMEEVGELARSIRKDTGLVRHQSSAGFDFGLELADVFLYVIHLANILNVDLSSVLKCKEEINHKRFLNAS